MTEQPAKRNSTTSSIVLLVLAVFMVWFFFLRGDGRTTAPADTGPETQSWSVWRAQSKVTVDEMQRVLGGGLDEADGRRMVKWLADEQSDQKAVTPDGCYRAAYSAYGHLIAQWHDAMQEAADGRLTDAHSQLSAANTTADRFAQAIRDAGADCS